MREREKGKNIATLRNSRSKEDDGGGGSSGSGSGSSSSSSSSRVHLLLFRTCHLVSRTNQGEATLPLSPKPTGSRFCVPNSQSSSRRIKAGEEKTEKMRRASSEARREKVPIKIPGGIILRLKRLKPDRAELKYLVRSRLHYKNLLTRGASDTPLVVRTGR